MDREKAEAYLRERLSAEESMSRNLYLWLGAAVTDICSILERYSVSADMLCRGNIPEEARQEADRVVESLIWMITDAALLLATDDREDESWFVVFFEREYDNGQTFAGRLEQYAAKFCEQVEMAYAALLLAGTRHGKSAAMKIRPAIDDVYNAPYVVSARRHDAVYFSPSGLGHGIPLCMSKALDVLTRQEIANAWMAWDYEEALSNGAKGYYVFRGSSYPCDVCDEASSVWHPIDEGMCLPEHVNCCCCAEWVY